MFITKIYNDDEFAAALDLANFLRASPLDAKQREICERLSEMLLDYEKRRVANRAHQKMAANDEAA